MKSTIKKIICLCIPLVIRKWMAIGINRYPWLSADKCGWWATQLLIDFAQKDINSYHKFLWQNHLSYAESYEVDLRFGYDNLNGTRKIFFSELQKNLKKTGLSPKTDIKSVFEVGCSLGYLLHYIETDIFPAATLIEGNDIDKYSIQEGKKYLSSENSKIKLLHADMEKLDAVLGVQKYDIVFGAGVLLYLKENSATKLVADMLKHTNKMLSFTGLAHPKVDNSELEHSVVRNRDGAWIHNIDKMITEAGGKIVARRCEGDKIIDGNTIYFVFAVPE
ncbi:MAG: class I SAM-dependent methyltransferase [Thiohalomonadales bacterium]